MQGRLSRSQSESSKTTEVGAPTSTLSPLPIISQLSFCHCQSHCRVWHQNVCIPFFVLFWDGVSLCGSGWSETGYIDQAGPKLWGLPGSASQMWRLKLCDVIPSSSFLRQGFLYARLASNSICSSRMTLNSWSSCLHLPNAGDTGIPSLFVYEVQWIPPRVGTQLADAPIFILFFCWESNPGLQTGHGSSVSVGYTPVQAVVELGYYSLASWLSLVVWSHLYRQGWSKVIYLIFSRKGNDSGVWINFTYRFPGFVQTFWP